MRDMKTIYFVTTNQKKADEYSAFARHLPVSVEPLFPTQEFLEPQINDQETIVLAKLAHARTTTTKPIFIDDVFMYTEKYPQFPGAYAKFINSSLGLSGWKALFAEGEKMTVKLMIGYSDYFSEPKIFTGELEGVLSFTNPEIKSDPLDLTSVFFIPKEKRFLNILLRDGNFKNHRCLAFEKLAHTLIEERSLTTKTILDATERWNFRAKDWNDFIKKDESYTNFQNGYERFNRIIKRIIPMVQGRGLDIGCGTGIVAGLMSENLKLDVLGIDNSGQMITEAEKNKKNNLIFDTKSISDLKEYVGQFSLVASRGIVLSHIPKSTAYDYLQQAAALVAPNGYLVFDFLTSKKIGGIPAIGDKGEFTFEQILRLMNDFGFTLVTKDGDANNRVIIVAFQKVGNNNS